jgi:hypothetical protein
MVDPDRPIACWMTKATIKHSEYIIIIVFPQQQWLHVRASLLLYSVLLVLFAVKTVES